MTMKSLLITAMTPLMLSAPVQAQAPATAPGGPPPVMELPAACSTGDSTAAGAMGAWGNGAMPRMEGHRGRMMMGMMETHGPMVRGMMNENPDLAFACGMIAHHQAAIRMSEAQMEFGADPTMRGMAEQIVEAQQREIEQLTNWVESQGGTATTGGAAVTGTTPSDPSAPAAGEGAGKSTATGGVPMEPAANATAPTDAAAPSDPSAPAAGEGAGKSTATGGVPMEPAADASAPAEAAAPADAQTPAAND